MRGSSSGRRPPSRSSSRSSRSREAPTDLMRSETSPLGRERLAIGFLAGQQPPARPSPTVFASERLSLAQRNYRHANSVPSSSVDLRVRRPFLPSRIIPGEDSQAISLPALLPGSQKRTYHLQVIQHPERSAEYASALLSRLSLAPPPIIKLQLLDELGASISLDAELPSLVAILSICAEDGSPLSLHSRGSRSRNPLLYGTLVSSAQTLRGLEGGVGCYFVFPDVSVRQRGRYVLKVTLVKLPRDSDPVVASVPQVATLAYAHTNKFDIVSRVNYVSPSLTPLTMYFMHQGVRMYSFESLVSNTASPGSECGISDP